MGLMAGISIEFILIFIYNLLCRWQGCQLVKLTWWMAIPFPLVFAFGTASAIASLHLEDY